MAKLMPAEKIENKIFQIRGKKVMLGEDLAELYSVETKQLTRQVRRNIKRFPNDFMFQLSRKELPSPGPRNRPRRRSSASAEHLPRALPSPDSLPSKGK